VSEADFLAEISENTFGSETEVELGLDALVMRLAGAIAYRRWLDRWRWGVGRSIDPLVDLQNTGPGQSLFGYRFEDDRKIGVRVGGLGCIEFCA